MAIAKKTEVIEIKPIQMKTVQVTIEGDTPLIMHAWSEKAKRELETFRDKYRTIKELAPVLAAIDEVTA